MENNKFNHKGSRRNKTTIKKDLTCNNYPWSHSLDRGLIDEQSNLQEPKIIGGFFFIVNVSFSVNKINKNDIIFSVPKQKQSEI